MRSSNAHKKDTTSRKCKFGKMQIDYWKPEKRYKTARTGIQSI
jgi:hypothetical protein